MKKRLAVIGVGSAGILSLAHFCSKLDNSWDIVSIHNPDIKIIGIGESTNPAVVETLEFGLNFSMLDDLKELDATYKFATRYKEWNHQHIDSPLLGGRSAIHFNNFKLKDFAFKRMEKMWPEKFKVLKGNVEDMYSVYDDPLRTSTGVKVIVDGVEHMFDYVIDCTGFPKDFSEYNVLDKMPVNHCLVHNIEEPGDWHYTGHVATDNGWMFQIPLQTRQSYGYLYNESITSHEDAVADFSKLINVPIDQLNGIEYSFKSYYAKEATDGRIFKNGNKFVFFEPMAASSMYMYAKLNLIYENHILTETNSGFPFPPNQTNGQALMVAGQIHDLICFFYHGGSLHKTPFWDYATEQCSAHLAQSGLIEYLKGRLTEPVKVGLYNCADIGVPYSAKSHVFFDQAFEHYYFTPRPE
jgi:tryptophan 7-halogenase